MTGANFVLAGWKEGLYKEGTNEVANADEEVESVDERSTFLRPKSKY